MAAVVRRVSNTYVLARVLSSFTYGCSYRTILFFSTDFSRLRWFYPGLQTAGPEAQAACSSQTLPAKKYRKKWSSVTAAIGGIRRAFFEKENYKRPLVFDRSRSTVPIVPYNRRRNSSSKCPVNDAHDRRVHVVDLTFTRTAGTTCTTPSPRTTQLPRLSSRPVATILQVIFVDIIYNWFFWSDKSPVIKNLVHFESVTYVSALSVVVKSLLVRLQCFPATKRCPTTIPVVYRNADPDVFNASSCPSKRRLPTISYQPVQNSSVFRVRLKFNDWRVEVFRLATIDDKKRVRERNCNNNNVVISARIAGATVAGGRVITGSI